MQKYSRQVTHVQGTEEAGGILVQQAEDSLVDARANEVNCSLQGRAITARAFCPHFQRFSRRANVFLWRCMLCNYDSRAARNGKKKLLPVKRI